MATTFAPDLTVNPNREVRSKKELISRRSAPYLARIFNASNNPGTLNPEKEYIPSPENYKPNEEFAFGLLQRASMATRKEYWEKGENKNLTQEAREEQFVDWWTENLMERYSTKEGDGTDKVKKVETLTKLGLDPDAMSPQSIKDFVKNFVGEQDVKQFVTAIRSNLTHEEITQNIDTIQFVAGMFDPDTAKDIAAILLLQPGNSEAFLPELGDKSEVENEEEINRLKYLTSFVNPETGNLIEVQVIKDKVREFDDAEQEISSLNSEKYGLAAIVGGRESMEDRSNISELDGGIFAEIYDGHGGDRVAQHVLDTLKKIYSGFLAQGMNNKDALRKAFAQVENSIPSEITGGATAVVSHITNNRRLIVGNAGDSRAVLVTTNGVNRLSHDHKPDDPEERYRIEGAGGYVSRESDMDVARVNGVLAVARSFGDKDHPEVVADPFISEINLSDEHESLVMASDGFFDVVSDEELPHLIKAFKTANPSATNEDLCKHLTKLAYERGSTDNITVTYLALK